MKNPGLGGLQSASTRDDSWLQTVYGWLTTSATTSNLVGLIGGVFALFLLLAMPEPWNIRLPLYLAVTVWTILRPRMALYLLPLAVPWGSLDTLDVGGLHLTSADILVVLLVAGWLGSFVLRPGRFRAIGAYAGPRDHDSFNVPTYLVVTMFALLCVMLLSMGVAVNISSSFKEISKWLEFLAVILLGAQYIRTRRQVWTLIVIILLAGISQAFHGYIQAFFNLGPEAFIRAASLRVYGTFDQPNPYAGYINMSLSIALALMLLGCNRTTRLLGGLATILLGTAEYLAQSRGGEISITAVLIFILVVGMPQLRTLTRLVIIGGLGIVEAFLAGWIPAHVLTPVLRILGLTQISFTAPSPEDYSTAERLAHWIAGIHMFLDHPILGVGIGNYPDAYPKYAITIFTLPLGHAHNYYINIAAETGFIGLVVYLLFLLAIFVAAVRAYRGIHNKYMQAQAIRQGPRPEIEAPLGTGNKLRLLLHPFRMAEHYRAQGIFGIVDKLTNDRALAVGILAALLSVCIHNMVDDLYVHSMTNLFALLFVALIRLEGVTPQVSAITGGQFDYIEHGKS
jgi:O-antigen ligase